MTRQFRWKWLWWRRLLHRLLPTSSSCVCDLDDMPLRSGRGRRVAKGWQKGGRRVAWWRGGFFGDILTLERASVQHRDILPVISRPTPPNIPCHEFTKYRSHNFNIYSKFSLIPRQRPLHFNTLCCNYCSIPNSVQPNQKAMRASASERLAQKPKLMRYFLCLKMINDKMGIWLIPTKSGNVLDH